MIWRGFDKAETAKEGESLNLARRSARLLRRRLRRRAWRLTKLARMLKREGLILDITLSNNPPKARLPRNPGNYESKHSIVHSPPKNGRV